MYCYIPITNSAEIVCFYGKHWHVYSMYRYACKEDPDQTAQTPFIAQTLHQTLCKHSIYFYCRDQARGRNFALNATQGEVGVSLKKKKKFFFFFFLGGGGGGGGGGGETHFHSVTTQMQAVVTLSDNLLPLLPLNGNSMCNGLFASKLTENAVILRYNFSLSDCHFSLIFLQGEVTFP